MDESLTMSDGTRIGKRTAQKLYVTADLDRHVPTQLVQPRNPFSRSHFSVEDERKIFDRPHALRSSPEAASTYEEWKQTEQGRRLYEAMKGERDAQRAQHAQHAQHAREDEASEYELSEYGALLDYVLEEGDDLALVHPWLPIVKRIVALGEQLAGLLRTFSPTERRVEFHATWPSGGASLRVSFVFASGDTVEGMHVFSDDDEVEGFEGVDDLFYASPEAEAKLARMEEVLRRVVEQQQSGAATFAQDERRPSVVRILHPHVETEPADGRCAYGVSLDPDEAWTSRCVLQ